MPDKLCPGTSLLHIHVTAVTMIDTERFPSSSINRNFSRLQTYFSEAVTNNKKDVIKQATCFGWLSHYQAIIDNIQKVLEIAAVSVNF